MYSSLSMFEFFEVYEYAIRKKLTYTENTQNTTVKKFDMAYFEKEPSAKKGTPIKCKFYALFLCLDGQLIRHVNQFDYQISKGTLHLVPPETIYYFENITETSEVLILHFTEEFFQVPSLKRITKIIQQLFTYHNNNFQPVHLSTEAFLAMKYTFSEIEKELLNRQTDYLSIIKLHIFNLLFLLKRHKELTCISQQKTISKPYTLVDDYLQLIEKYYLTLSQVSDYAKLLNITPKYLGELVKKHLNNDALFYIHNRKLKEALYLLRFSPISIVEISHHLGFLYQSDFNRFFKKYQHVTPKQFRLSFKK